MKKLVSLLLALCLMLPLCAAAGACSICGGDSVCDTCGGLGYVAMKVYGSDEVFNAACTAGCKDGKCPACAADCASCSDDGLCDVCGGWGYTGSKYDASVRKNVKILCTSETCEDGACTACNKIRMDAVYVFENKLIEEAVRKEMNRTGDVTYGDLRSIMVLHLNEMDLTDISDLTYMIGIKDLQLADNSITDISPLAGMTAMLNLDLSDNSISDLSPLAKMTALKNLDLSANSISDISPLAGLSNINDLRLMINQISDISPLAKLKNITYLGLGDNSITDISALSGMSKLKTLQLIGNSISDTSPLDGLDCIVYIRTYTTPKPTAKPSSSSTKVILPDPMSFSFNLQFAENEDSDHCYERRYLAETTADASQFVLAYVEELMNYEQFTYAQCTTAPSGWVYHVFSEAPGYNYSDFYSHASDTGWRTENCVVIVNYKPDNRNVYILSSTDFEPLPIPKASTPTPAPNRTKCNICGGDGKCDNCGGDSWYEGYAWSYDSNGLPQNKLVRKFCSAVYCNAGKCDRCGGDGWID